jgi:signal transduction histidine kinase
VSDTLVRNASELTMRNQQLTALVDLGLRLASEPDPNELLQLACASVRELLGADGARVWLFEPDVAAVPIVVYSGPIDVWESIPLLEAKELAALAHQGRILRQAPSHADGRATISAPIATRSRMYGGLALAGAPADSRAFELDAEQMLPLLVSHVSLAYQNAQWAQELRVALQARDEFLLIAAHELKTPVTSLGGYAQLLTHTLDGRETVDVVQLTRPLQTIERQTLRLSRLVERLLDVSRLETGQLNIRREPTDVAALVREVMEAASARATEHVLVEHTPVPAPALVDPLRLEQVLVNLLDNAQKFSPPGSEISVEVTTPDPRSVLVAVQDHGTGVPMERRGRLFDRFYQAHADSNQSGMGLGLHLCRRIVEQHGGRIWAEFPAGGGTRFVVQLPANDL